MVRFLEAFRTHWYRSYSPIYPIKRNPKSTSETLAMVKHDFGHGNAIELPRKLANTSLNTKTTTNHVNNARIMKHDFKISKNKPIRDFSILDGFE